MAFQKLTYNGSKCNNYLYFSIDGEYFDPSKITIELNIEPTSVNHKKDPIPKRTSWKFKIEVGKDPDLATPTEKLINIFEPKIDTIIRLKKEYNLSTRLQYVMDIDINPESSAPYFPMNKRIISFLYKTNTDVDFDIYKADTIGLFLNE